MPEKVCPRCGAQYKNLRSKTCPQCFAVLVSVDEATAEELAAARAQVEETPEFQQAKAEDDERFKEQSFGACLTVIGITVATLILAVILIASAAHRRTVPKLSPVMASARPVALPEPLTTLPVAAAGLNDVMPRRLASERGPFQRMESDQDLILPGTLTPIFHAVYQSGDHQILTAYAIPAGRPTSEQNQFRLGITLAAQMDKAKATPDFFATEYWHYAAVSPAPSDSESFETALAAFFRAKEK